MNPAGSFSSFGAEESTPSSIKLCVLPFVSPRHLLVQISKAKKRSSLRRRDVFVTSSLIYFNARRIFTVTCFFYFSFVPGVGYPTEDPHFPIRVFYSDVVTFALFFFFFFFLFLFSRTQCNTDKSVWCILSFYFPFLSFKWMNCEANSK
eukprot:TRINITY_DN5348_c0_g1_i1.p1 TRINITY_DN5348_c0_g1~~TRINITY_DN5348_c0_g1_i1.p1  ORF type:complete len:149 (+),score=0.96 TRINITY_DN5348_c0_g1_i1:116-562(+)